MLRNITQADLARIQLALRQDARYCKKLAKDNPNGAQTAYFTQEANALRALDALLQGATVIHVK
jgi:hypothetical protein